ncbi:E3 ubiquitin-protein ligase NRDP1-like [Ruditapes philippinarum]|uniref:E3 ubiquitin-protein ligase NRDP1-like n=1 Tax=Ruditapes philippinarum TaxID=129788 RepID=UPI00295B314B|nr:E3 ubiquitin-protein ligase NRDP1-like [Ruditapes philippinarum]XP_060592313.1 E3 ubiquitin-protein ligase NRDP1-like [Ruditapes philippinarum]
MGYEVHRFEGDVDEELICPICSGVLEEPLQAPACEHAFCASCIQEWLTRQPTCPVDRNPITPNQLKPVPRILRNLLSRLHITCDNKEYGCTVVVKLDMLPNHLNECEFNPKKPVHCELGCGLVVPKDELKEHNCVRELRNLVNQQTQKMAEMQTEIAEHKLQINEQKRELQLLKEYMRSMRVSNPRMREIQTEMEQSDIVRWTNSLQTARVTRWGGMISTPDAVLQAVIKRSLIDSGCPSHIVNELMENAHERRWPAGLATLETRQINRRQYENYVTKRIPGKQAVVVTSIENQHMPEDLIMEPGLVMIFAHGVE